MDRPARNPRSTEADRSALRRSERQITLLIGANHALVHARDEHELLQRVCELATADGGYRLSWVGAAIPKGKAVRPIAQAGFEAGYLDGAEITWDESPRGLGPTGRAVRTRVPQVSRDFLHDPAMAPWRADAVKRGYASSAAIPFVVDDQVLVFHAYADHPDAFDDAELDTLQQMADDLAVGVSRFRAADERDRAVELLRDSEERLRVLNTELEARVEERTAELELVNRNLEAFTYSVSHDLRAPLRALSGFSQALLDEVGDRVGEAGQRYLAHIQTATERMNQLIEDLLGLSRVSRAELRLEDVDLSSVAQHIAEQLQHDEPGRRARFQIEAGVQVVADRQLISTVLQNLLENAWKFTSGREDALIEFGTAPVEDASVCCYVRDDGAGFDPRYADRLFQPFQRLHTDAEFPGSGIGLASVRRIIERHGGRTWAEGAVDAGATVYFTLGDREVPRAS